MLSDAARPGVKTLLDLVGDQTLTAACAGADLPEPQDAAEARGLLLAADGADPGGGWLYCEVPRRRPRLAWQGMHLKPAVAAVPTQVQEVVRPGLAVRRHEQQQGIEGLGVARTRAEYRPPVNRLIWTNDNLVALKTLLEERDPETRDWRYRGKVDLVYIDPPFMVNADFVADNAITIELDGEAGVSATKEPSLVEILAYKDTWREGLDSFLSMIRARLVLLKELLAPTGSIYVHLDWHTAHYVKVLMDEIFGYENFRNQVVWQRTTAHNDPKQFGRIHDVLFWYVPNTGDYFYKPVRLDGYSSEQLARYRESDANGRFTGRDLTAPGIRYGETGEPWRGLNPTASGRHWSRPRPNLKNCYRKARSCSRRTELPGSMV